METHSLTSLSLVLNRYYHSFVVTPEDSSIVPMDLVNPIESICNPLEERKNKFNFMFSWVNKTDRAKRAPQTVGVFSDDRFLVWRCVYVYSMSQLAHLKRNLLLVLGAAEMCETAADRCNVSFPGSVWVGWNIKKDLFVQFFRSRSFNKHTAPT